MKQGKKADTPKKRKPRIAYVEQGELEELSLALRCVREEKKASVSLIQRRLKIGYSRAALLLDRLEQLAVVTPMKGLAPCTLTGYMPRLKALPVAKTPPPAKIEELQPAPTDIGRPSIYSEELAKAICERIATGESVLQICRDTTMPAPRTVYLWLLDVDKKDFVELYTKAREIQAEVMHDELTDIADDGSNDWMEIETASGRMMTVPDHEYINRSRLRVDTRKWIIARMNPKKYGEKLDLTSGGKEIKQPRPVAINYGVPPQPAAV